MRVITHATSLVVLLALGGPTVAQQDTAPKPVKQSTKALKPPAARGQGAYMGLCGDWFRCYTGIPLQCGENTRPYQDIANHTCFCVHDGCPQQ